MFPEVAGTVHYPLPTLAELGLPALTWITG